MYLIRYGISALCISALTPHCLHVTWAAVGKQMWTWPSRSLELSLTRLSAHCALQSALSLPSTGHKMVVKLHAGEEGIPTPLTSHHRRELHALTLNFLDMTLLVSFSPFMRLPGEYNTTSSVLALAFSLCSPFAFMRRTRRRRLYTTSSSYFLSPSCGGGTPQPPKHRGFRLSSCFHVRTIQMQVATTTVGELSRKLAATVVHRLKVVKVACPRGIVRRKRQSEDEQNPKDHLVSCILPAHLVLASLAFGELDSSGRPVGDRQNQRKL